RAGPGGAVQSRGRSGRLGVRHRPDAVHRHRERLAVSPGHRSANAPGDGEPATRARGMRSRARTRLVGAYFPHAFQGRLRAHEQDLRRIFPRRPAPRPHLRRRDRARARRAYRNRFYRAAAMTPSAFAKLAAAQAPKPGKLTLDHIAHFVPDLDNASPALEKLGFTLTPFSAQSHRLEPGGPLLPAGTGNRCIMLKRGYLECLAPTGDTTVANQLRTAIQR